MKRLFVAFLAIVMLTTIFGSSALAEGDLTNYAFCFSAQCVNTSVLSHASQFHLKTSDCNFIEVRHAVIGNGSNGGYNNYIYCYVEEAGYYGAKWQAPDMLYYCCTSDWLWEGDSVTPGGRGNTKYNEYLGLTNIRIEGQFRPH